MSRLCSAKVQGMIVRLVASLVGLLAVPACVGEGTGRCRANVDCSEGAACVAGECTTDSAECTDVGAFADVWAGPLPGAESAIVFEAHAAVDAQGAVHLCWSGQDGSGAAVSVYAEQTAWNVFESSSLALGDGTLLNCGAIAVGADGTPFVLSRSPAAIASYGSSGWVAAPLAGLEGPEAAGAISSANAMITLTPDGGGGAYVAISIGFLVSNQAVYLAHYLGTELEVIVNGWAESGAHTSVGHGPQFIVVTTDATRVLRGNVGASVIELTDATFNLFDTVDGYYARSAASPDLTAARTAYFDKNFILRVADIANDEFTLVGDLGALLVDDTGDGIVPWEIAVDNAATTHLLVLDLSQGPNALVYRTLDAAGAASAPIIISMSFAADLPGTQRYALGTDLCGRATIVIVEADGEAGGAKLVVMEGR